MQGARRERGREIDPDEIFLDSSNLPGRNEMQFEGRVVRPVSERVILGVGVVFALVVAVFSVRAFELQVVHGDSYADISRNNRLERTVLFAARGIIYDRTGRTLAWNEAESGVATSTFLRRRYVAPGLSHVLGFVQYPRADRAGRWWREEYTGIAGAELAFDDRLRGENGSRLVETDARKSVVRSDIVAPARDGADITLSVDGEMQETLYTLLLAHANRQGFKGGASVIMDVQTGELLALTSVPEYDNNAFTGGKAEVIARTTRDSRSPLLNHAIAGLYTPGSIVKPIFAAAALNEGVISADKNVLSTGAITVPNPYDPDRPSVFRDWTAHGWVDMRTAIAVSSDEYFYTVGGGFGGQEGLGIARLDEYARLFGLGARTGIALRGEEAGVIPTPEWKAEVFGPDDPWRIGNTYHTAIGQYGFQVTPLQAVRFTAAIANGGKLLTPQLLASSTPAFTDIGIPDQSLQVVREGMRLAVTSDRNDATVKSLYIGGIRIAAKTGTAQTGAKNEYINSWSVGFWPAENPRYAYATVLERAPAGTLSGSAPAMLPFFQWLIEHRPQYID
jgi:penicillin-binding protein 2